MNFGDVIMSSDFLRNGVLGCGETWVVACMAMDVLDRGPMLLAEGAGLLGLRWTHLGTGVSEFRVADLGNASRALDAPGAVPRVILTPGGRSESGFWPDGGVFRGRVT